MSHALHIINGRVYDPAHGVDGEVRDIFIVDGRVVEALPEEAAVRQIDAAGLVVMPGGVEMHAHLASASVNQARAIQGATGYDRVVPTAGQTGRLYAGLGYTTGIEAAVAPQQARVSHMQLDDLPFLDTGLLLLLANHEGLIERLERNDQQGATAMVQHMLTAAGAFGIKAVNPAAIAAWRRRAGAGRIESIDQPIAGQSRVSPRTVLEALTEAQETLDLAHPTHIHGPQLGEPGNVAITLDMLAALQGRRFHLAHLQYYAYGKTKRGGLHSEVERLLDGLAHQRDVTADLGLVAFGPAFTATADLPLEHDLYRHVGVTSKPAYFLETANEDCFGVMPLVHTPASASHSVQWATGLELALLWDDPWRYALTVDHPNGGSFLNYPELIACLMNKAYRDERLEACHAAAKKRTGLAGVTREMTLQDIATITRAAPARALGLTGKGHLGVGADGDVTIYNDAANDPAAMFASPRYVIKAGAVIVNDGNVAEDRPGRRLAAALSPSDHGQWLADAWQDRHGSYQARQPALDAVAGTLLPVRREESVA